MAEPGALPQDETAAINQVLDEEFAREQGAGPTAEPEGAAPADLPSAAPAAPPQVAALPPAAPPPAAAKAPEPADPLDAVIEELKKQAEPGEGAPPLAAASETFTRADVERLIQEALAKAQRPAPPPPPAAADSYVDQLVKAGELDAGSVTARVMGQLEEQVRKLASGHEEVRGRYNESERRATYAQLEADRISGFTRYPDLVEAFDKGLKTGGKERLADLAGAMAWAARQRGEANTSIEGAMGELKTVLDRASARLALKMLMGRQEAKKAAPSVKAGGAPPAPKKTEQPKRWKSAADMERGLDTEITRTLKEK